jgi:hypothetical protein
MAKPDPNFHFFLGRENTTYKGIRASEVPDPYGERNGLIPSLVVGPQLTMKTEKPVRWAKIIPPGMNDVPDFVSGERSDKIVRGSIIATEVEGGKRHILVSHRDEKAYYVLVRTGLKAVNGSIVQDRLNIQKDGSLVTHGSYSFDTGSIRIAAANNESDIQKVLGDPNANIGTVAAERLDSKAIGKRIPLLNCPQSSYVLWRMPYGAALLVRDVNGKLTRLVATKAELQVRDAIGYDAYFNGLEEGHRAMVHRERAKAAGAD